MGDKHLNGTDHDENWQCARPGSTPTIRRTSRAYSAVVALRKLAEGPTGPEKHGHRYGLSLEEREEIWRGRQRAKSSVVNRRPDRTVDLDGVA
ncbi:hypothetical protein BH24ACT15_BH24ACT15_34460 [soil metagenome]